MFGSCRAAGDWIILPDDGSFSADTHVATQNTGIARTGSMLLRRRRGYVNWGVNAGRRDAHRRDAVPLCRQPRGRLRAAAVPCPRPQLIRESVVRGRRGDAEISLFTIGRDSNSSATKRKRNCVSRVHRARREGENCTCSHTHGMHASTRSTVHNNLVIITSLKNFARYRDSLESKTSAYLFPRYACVPRM